MDSVFPWMMVGVSLAMIYLRRVMREMEQNAVRAQARGQLPQNFPLQRLVFFRQQLESRQDALWIFLVVGSLWGLQNLFV
jgi:hypothetical protein